MPVHDWTRVDAGIFHDFHLAWIAELRRTLNRGLLPRGYYALAEQVTGNLGPDVLTLNRPDFGPYSSESSLSEGGIAVADAPPKVRFHAKAEVDLYARKAKAVVIRHRSGHKVIAMIEIVSPGNKSSQTELKTFVENAVQALSTGINLLIVNLFPPTKRDPVGIHRLIWGEDHEGDYALTDDKPLSCVSYVGMSCLEVYLDPIAVGDALPDMPLFLTAETYVPLPLEATYQSAWEAVPDFLQEVLAAPARPKAGRGKLGRRKLEK